MSELEDIVEGFREYDRIVVTGPQRSGTQIASMMIADILDWEFIAENLAFDKRFTQPDKSVMQCPGASHRCHLLPKTTLVVFMIRDVEEITASDNHRVASFMTMRPVVERHVTVKSVFIVKGRRYANLFYNGERCPISEVPQRIYDVWNDIQKKEDFNWYELDYTLLEQHRLWVPLEERRRYFNSGTQTSLEWYTSQKEMK